ncbi:Crp/Fnr family transcriptional regulator [Lichenibacterium minor]|uniref:Crp/Fnr family transcriptional regulator n=1 Tax=Lichenibacterium minor TaxID=2316528 RepID=A0A4Q2U2B0_9HYPH|nr:Crp/Fnr family transcriptional regulator [Lichenibacterium minor]RYC28967.1 Crp/Fnr family transcriptional regulator [Lichenibacterium minor]
MENLLIRKLERFAPLSSDDRKLLDEIVIPSRLVPARSDLIREGQTSDNVRLILKGFACRYKLLPTGGRQIVGYLLPGDFCDLHVCILNAMDHSIATLSPCTVVDIPRQRILDLTDRPGIARAFWWVTLVDEGTLREWLLNIGQRHALQRIAHLLCELFTRLQTVGLAEVSGFELPLTQADIGDTAGLSYVHVNRCVQTLRDMGMITIKNRAVVINDLDRLMKYTSFNPNYLHLDGVYRVG